MENLIKQLSPMMRMRLHTVMHREVWDLERDLEAWEEAKVPDTNEAKQQMLGWLKAAKELEQALKD